jgi:hypothetical protein
MRAIHQKAIAICRERAQGNVEPQPTLRRNLTDRKPSLCRRLPTHFVRSTPQVQTESNQMQNLSPRHVKTEEALRLGVLSGWYSTKVSGTFVSGPHDSEADCLSRIAEINPPAKKRK